MAILGADQHVGTSTIHGMGAFSCDLSMALDDDSGKITWLTHVGNLSYGHVSTCHDIGAVSCNLSMVLDDDSGEITRLTHVGNLSQNDGYIHTVKTPWEV